MSAFTLDQTVGELVREHPARSRIFERLGIDYCCGGKKSLAEVCAAKKLDPQTVIRTLQAVEAERGYVAGEDPAAMTLTELADHIEATHHAYLKTELPRLHQIINKVATVHGGAHPELAQVLAVFNVLQDEMIQHMAKEERILFPIIRQLEAAKGPSAFHCGSISNPIGVMEREHESAGDALRRIRSLTADYAVPESACNTYRVMLDSLARLEADMHQHVHKENNILFPAAIALERGKA